MSRLYLNLVKGSIFIGCLFLLSIQAYTQGCCPLPGQCNPCSGGISVLKLQYHGTAATVVRIYDNSPIPIFDQLVQPGGTIDLIGQSNGKFESNELHIRINLWDLNAIILVSCSLQFDPSTFFGLFTIISAQSKSGGALCCTSNNGFNDPPVIIGCPLDIQATTASNCSAIVTWTPPVAEQCDVISFVSTHSPGSSFPLGTTAVVYTATNQNNFTSACTFDVTVTDATAPTVVTTTPNVVVNAGANCNAIATWTPPGFADNCGVTSVASTKATGSSFSLGNTTVTYTASDAAGNTKTSSFTVTVNDVTAPNIITCPTDVIVNVASGCQAVATWTPPVFTDTCSPVTVTASHTPGSIFQVGSTDVVYTARDNSNNTAVCLFNVIVKDQSAPIITGCPRDTTVSTTSVSGSVLTWTPPESTDDCSAPSLTATHQSGASFPLGITTVTYTATDVSGNTSSCSFQVNIVQENSSLDIVQLVTPGGDTFNDTWIIGNIELYADNKVTVVDRWGNVIYSTVGYDNERNVWNGDNKDGKAVPSGTYFYTILVRSGNKTMENKGFIEVVR